MYRFEPFTPTDILNQTKTLIIPVTDATLFVEALNRRPIVADDINRDVYLRYISDYRRWPLSPDGIYFLQVESARGGLVIKREDNGTYRRLAIDNPERFILFMLKNEVLNRFRRIKDKYLFKWIWILMKTNKNFLNNSTYQFNTQRPTANRYPIKYRIVLMNP